MGQQSQGALPKMSIFEYNTLCFRTNSTIYKLNKARKQFDVFQEIDTYRSVQTVPATQIF